MYEMNKSLIVQLPDISKKDLEAGKKKINQLASNGKYFMLLCNELKYYTVFDTLDDAIEIWIQKDDEAYVMYFFNYDEGVEICAI